MSNKDPETLETAYDNLEALNPEEVRDR